MARPPSRFPIGIGVLAAMVASPAAAQPAAARSAFLEAHCAGCHNDIDRKGGLDLESLAFKPEDPANQERWIRIHDRVASGEMPPAEKRRPEPSAAADFTRSLGRELTAADRDRIAREGRTLRRRLNGHEYENALRDLLSAPWLQVRGQFPEDGEAHRYNKSASALDVSHVHLSRYLTAADHALRQILATHLARRGPEGVAAEADAVAAGHGRAEAVPAVGEAGDVVARDPADGLELAGGGIGVADGEGGAEPTDVGLRGVPEYRIRHAVGRRVEDVAGEQAREGALVPGVMAGDGRGPPGEMRGEDLAQRVVGGREVAGQVDVRDVEGGGRLVVTV
ncbi:MAG: DUF1587 domain-containing protein, partial [Opitutaceae bacterium]